MLKKSLATALLVCAIPAMANAAWQLTTQAMNLGGTLTTPNGTQDALSQTLTTTQSSLSALTAAQIFATPDGADTLRSLTIVDSYVNGAGVLVKDSISLPFTPVDDHQYTVSATFQVQSLAVSAGYASGSYGTVTPTSLGNIYNGYTVITPITFMFAPKAGYTISAVAGVPSGATLTLPAAANQRATVVFPAGYTFTAPVSLVATDANATPTLYPIAAQNAVAGSSVSITPSVLNVPTPNYIFTYVSGPQNDVAYTTDANGKVHTNVIPGPAVTLTATATKATFTAPSAPGQYKFTVQETVSGMTKLAVVNVVATAADVSNQCQFCHTANKIDDLTIGTRYQASIHGQSTHSACSSCHFGVGGAAHPGTVNGDSVNPLTFKANVDGVAGGYGLSVTKGNVFCASCHSGSGYPVYHVIDANSPQCVGCHTPSGAGDAHDIQNNENISVRDASCQTCHGYDATYWAGKTDSNGNPLASGKLLSTAAGSKANDCVACHDVIIQHPGKGFVNDNNGVRAVVGEFRKWSHHIVNANGADPINEQCAACHLEGTVVSGALKIDPTKHMADDKIHLRNAQSDADMVWDPANPNHTTMDNFCMSCHSQNGATSAVSAQLQSIISGKTGITASALNPFGDTISNRYDKMMRPRVTNVDSQFNTTNNSHHAVKGARYSGRTRAAGARQIAYPATFAANSSATLQGIRSTIYDAGAFNALYTPLENAGGEAAPRTGAATLGDDSTLHCGDCHTVGQWKQGTAQSFIVNADGSMTVDTTKTSPAIGAHGSNNEYMLRNSLGTDERHVGVAYTSSANVVTVKNSGSAYLVCYNCHAYKSYGSIYVGTGMDGGNDAGSEMGNQQAHAGEYANQNRCNGPGNTLPFNGFTSGSATDGTQFEQRFVAGMAGEPTLTAADTAAGYQAPKGFGNVYGIQCLNCHNSGYGNAYGGIHGSANNTNTVDATTKASVTGGAYIDGNGNTTKVERFLPGLGNAMFVPGNLGGVTNGVTNDTNWEQKHGAQTASSVFTFTKTAVQTGTAITGNAATTSAGCYTLSASTTAATNKLRGPSVTGPGGAETEAMDTWGGCEDHGGAQGSGTAFFKKIVRPVSY